MPLKSLFKAQEHGSWENCCKVPKAMTISPPLPADYEAYIHRCGWILYVHKPTKQQSWMHPVRLADFEAKGLKGPGEYGPEMWIFEKNVNYGGHYCVDYGYPPLGHVCIGGRPSFWDFKEIDRLGFDEWKKQMYTKAADIEATRSAEEGEPTVVEKPGIDGVDGFTEKFADPEWRKKYNEVKRTVMEAQSVWDIPEEYAIGDM